MERREKICKRQVRRVENTCVHVQEGSEGWEVSGRYRKFRSKQMMLEESLQKTVMKTTFSSTPSCLHDLYVSNPKCCKKVSFFGLKMRSKADFEWNFLIRTRIRDRNEHTASDNAQKVGCLARVNIQERARKFRISVDGFLSPRQKRQKRNSDQV